MSGLEFTVAMAGLSVVLSGLALFGVWLLERMVGWLDDRRAQ